MRENRVSSIVFKHNTAAAIDIHVLSYVRSCFQTTPVLAGLGQRAHHTIEKRTKGATVTFE